MQKKLHKKCKTGALRRENIGTPIKLLRAITPLPKSPFRIWPAAGMVVGITAFARTKKEKHHTMTVARVAEISATSPKGFEAAIE